MAENKRPSGLTAHRGIELLTFGTPNGFKIAILLEELKQAYGKDYTYQSIDIFQNVQKEPWFTQLNPNGRIPVIVDHDKGGYTVMETLAIMSYLTRFYDPEYKFSFQDPLDACTAEQWLAWQHGGLGPMQSQANLFYRFHQDRYAFPTQRYVGETERYFGILDTRLADRDYVAGPSRGKYSIADIAIWPFAEALAVAGIELEKFPNLLKWWERIGERPAVQKGMTIPSGQPFRFGIKQIQNMREEDPAAFERSEGPLREALQRAREEFGYEYRSP